MEYQQQMDPPRKKNRFFSVWFHLISILLAVLTFYATKENNPDIDIGALIIASIFTGYIFSVSVLFLLGFFGILGKGLTGPGVSGRTSFNQNNQFSSMNNQSNNLTQPKVGQYDPSRGRKREWYDH